MANFRKIGERMLPLDIVHVKINPSMDILALALSSSDIAINRLYSWQRVWSIPKPRFKNETTETIRIVDMIWSTDGKILAVAYNQPIEQENKRKESSNNETKKYLSSIVLYMIETNQRACVHNLEYEITSFCWQVKSYCQSEESFSTKSISIDELKLPLDSVNIPYVDLFICNDELLNYPFMTNSSKTSKPNDSNKYPSGKNPSSNLPPLFKFSNNNEFSDYDKMNLLQNKTFNVLIVGTKENVVLFYLFGYYEIMKIHLDRFLQDKLFNNDYQIDRIWMSPDFNCVQVFLTQTSKLNIEHSDLFLYETKLLRILWKEIFLVNRIQMNIDIRLEFLNDSIEELCSTWSDIVVDIESRLCNYRIVSETDPSDQIKLQLKSEDFVDLLIFGNISFNLERFLHDISKKEITKLYNSFETSINSIYSLTITRVINSLVHIRCFLDTLRGMVLNDLQFGDLGFSIEHVNTFRREVALMILKCNKMMIALNDLKRKMLAFTRLIYKGVFMVQYALDRNEYENVKFVDDQTIGKMTLQDFHLVMDFLVDSSFDDGFQFHIVSKLLKNSSIQKPSRPREGQDSVNTENPYKKYLEEKHLKHFIEVLNNNSENLNELSQEEIIEKFFFQQNSNLKFENLKENDQDETRNWFQMLLNDHSNIDSIDEQICDNEWSFRHHLERLNHIKWKLFHHSYCHMNDLQTKLIEESENKITFQFLNNKMTQKTYNYLPVGLDCYNILRYQKKSNETQSGYLYVSKFSNSFEDQNQSIMSLYRLEQPLQPNKIDLIQFNLISKCFGPCRCEQVQFYMEDCQFYDTDLMTMIVTEKHSKSFKEHSLATDSINNSCTEKQYLIQFQYRKLFDFIPDHVIQLPFDGKFPNQNEFIDLSLKIDLSLIDCIENSEQQMQVDDDVEKYSNVESLFKLRCLEMNNQQKSLSVSGNRNLACCLDLGRCRITTFEMDSTEDDEDAVNIVPDEEGNNIDVAQLVEITPDGKANLNHNESN